METIEEEKQEVLKEENSSKVDESNSVAKEEERTAQEQSSSKTSGASAESLAELAQAIIDEMEEKRKNDTTLVEEFKKSMEFQLEGWMSVIQSSLSHIYKKNNDACQSKIQELYTILNRISQLEREMAAFKQSLKLLCNEVDA